MHCWWLSRSVFIGSPAWLGGFYPLLCCSFLFFIVFSFLSFCRTLLFYICLLIYISYLLYKSLYMLRKAMVVTQGPLRLFISLTFFLGNSALLSLLVLLVTVIRRMLPGKSMRFHPSNRDIYIYLYLYFSFLSLNWVLYFVILVYV